jgi:hypothetical protein
MGLTRKGGMDYGSAREMYKNEKLLLVLLNAIW